MVASKTFDSILEQIQTSNLNFQLQISPFSANISLKRSPIKDKSGAPMCLPLGSQSCLPSSTDAAALASKIINLERDLESLRKDYEFAVEDSVEAHQKIKYLESQHAVKIEPNEALKKELSEKNYLVNSLNVQISQVSKENYCCQRKNLVWKSKILKDLRKNLMKFLTNSTRNLVTLEPNSKRKRI